MTSHVDPPGDEPGDEAAGSEPESSAAWQRRLRERGAGDARDEIRRQADRAREDMDQMMAEAAREAGGQAESLAAELDARARLLQDLISRADTATRQLNQAIEKADMVAERARTTTIEAEARLSGLLDGLLIDLREIGDQMEWG